MVKTGESAPSSAATANLLRIAACDVLDAVNGLSRDVLSHSIACQSRTTGGGRSGRACDCGATKLRDALNELRRQTGRFVVPRAAP